MTRITQIDYGAWAACRLRDGADITEVDENRMTGHWVEWLGLCRTLNGADRRAVFENWVRHHPDGREIIGQMSEIPPGMVIYQEQPDQGHRQAGLNVLVDVPELPTEVRLTAQMEHAATNTGEFLDNYCDYATMIVNTLPRDMNEAAALAVTSIAVARRIRFPIWYTETLFPILWVLWVARSTIFGKTTGLTIARRLIRSTMPHLLLPEESSADRLIHELSGKDPSNYGELSMMDQERWQQSKLHAGQRGLVIDEASSLFSGFRKDYNLGQIETLLKAYDCEEEKIHSTVKHGNTYLRHLYMPMLGATTPAAIQQAANLQMWQMGFWPRWVLLVPDRLPDAPVFSEELISRPITLDHAILRLLEFLPKPEKADLGSVYKAPVHLVSKTSSEVLQYFRKYVLVMKDKFQKDGSVSDERLQPIYGRLPNRVLQVATLLAALDWNGKDVPSIDMSHYARAIQIVERWRVNAHRFVAVMDQPLTGEDREQRVMTAIRHLQQTGIPATAREIQRLLHWQRDQIDALLAQMLADSMIDSGDSPGKRSKVWRVCQ